VFANASSEVDTTFQWSPFQDYVYTQWQNDFGLAINGKISFLQALEKLQNDTVTYARSQGFSVN
jgi:multiple sugar transport system substrate-binding protein